MGNYQRNLLQTCYYWEKMGTDIYGAPTLSAPILVDCRWEDVSEAVIDKLGNEIVSKSRIFTAINLPPEGFLRLAKAGDVIGDIDPLNTEDGADEIRQVKSIPNLRNPLEILYTTWL